MWNASQKETSHRKYLTSLYAILALLPLVLKEFLQMAISVIGKPNAHIHKYVFAMKEI